MENNPKDLSGENLEKNTNKIDSLNPLEKYKIIFDGILSKASVLHQDFDKIKNNPNSLPFTERGMEFLNYITETSDGPFIRDFIEDLEKMAENENDKNNFEKIRKLFSFKPILREAQGIIWNIDENSSQFLSSMEILKESDQKISMIKEEDIARIVLFYKLSEVLENDIKKMSEIFKEDFNQ